MSKSIELADAIVALLNDENAFSFEFEAKRREAALSQQELEDLTTVEVFVFPGTTAKERITRVAFKTTYRPLIVIQRPLEGKTPEAEQLFAKKLQTLVEEIENGVQDVDLADLSFTGFQDEQERDQYDAIVLADLKCFVQTISPEYIGWPVASST